MNWVLKVWERPGKCGEGRGWCVGGFELASEVWERRERGGRDAGMVACLV